VQSFEEGLFVFQPSRSQELCHISQNSSEKLPAFTYRKAAAIGLRYLPELSEFVYIENVK